MLATVCLSVCLSGDPRNPTAKPSSVVLSSGHCLHCMSPYATEQMEEGACKYHSGFLGESE